MTAFILFHAALDILGAVVLLWIAFWPERPSRETVLREWSQIGNEAKRAKRKAK